MCTFSAHKLPFTKQQRDKETVGLFYTLLINPSRKITAALPGKGYTAAARVTIPSHASVCWIFLCLRNPPNFDMDYRIFNVRTWSFLCVRIHTRVGHTDSESAQHFWLCQIHEIFRVLQTGLELGSWNMKTDALPSEPHRHHQESSNTLGTYLNLRYSVSARASPFT